MEFLDMLPFAISHKDEPFAVDFVMFYWQFFEIFPLNEQQQFEPFPRYIILI